MKLILIITSAFFFISVSNADTCEFLSKDLSEFVNNNALTNCLNSENDSGYMQNEFHVNSICNCTPGVIAKLPQDKNKELPDIVKKSNIKEKKKDTLLNLAFDEFNKVIANNLVDVAKLRSMGRTSFTFTSSIQSCSRKSADDLSKDLRDCDPLIRNKIISNMDQMGNILATELAHILSPSQLKDSKSGIFSRDVSKNLCPISEKDVLLARNTTFEKNISSELLQAIANLDPQEVDSLESINIKLRKAKIPTKDFSNLRQEIVAHPLLSQYSPQELILLIKQLNPKTSKGLTDHIYSKNFGDNFDKKLAGKCEESFKALTNTVCSKSFDSGDFNLNPLEHYSHFGIYTQDTELITDSALLTDNIRAHNYCQISTSPGSNNGFDQTQKISKQLSTEWKEVPFYTYKRVKYRSDIGDLFKDFCDIEADNSKCKEGVFACEAYKKYKNDKLSNSSNSSNSEINSLLRAMIGTPSNISKESKEILVTQGILPKDDGQLVKQPDDPIRRSDFVGKPSSTSSTQTEAAASPGPTSANQTTSASNQARNNNSGYQNTFPTSAGGGNTASADSADEGQNLNRIQDEIMRRLASGASSNQNKTPTKKEVTQMAREVAKERGQKLTPAQERSLAQSAFDSQNNGSPTSEGFADPTSTVSEGDTYQEKVKKQSEYDALAGMQGNAKQIAAEAAAEAASAGRSPASLTEDKDKKLAINAEVKGDKIIVEGELLQAMAKNDETGMLLRSYIESKQDFTLVVNNVAFKVSFDKKLNTYSIKHDSGDEKVANQIRPQLVNFFGRFKTKRLATTETALSI